jgi:K+-transporting ATPase KdpF subunit
LAYPTSCCGAESIAVAVFFHTIQPAFLAALIRPFKPDDPTFWSRHGNTRTHPGVAAGCGYLGSLSIGGQSAGVLMSAVVIISLILAVALAVYLLIALLKPEKFQ